jgi:hypothetical protein
MRRAATIERRLFQVVKESCSPPDAPEALEDLVKGDEFDLLSHSASPAIPGRRAARWRL